MRRECYLPLFSWRRWRKNGGVQGLFELIGIPYVGSGVLASAAGMDKVVTKQLFEKEWIIPLPNTYVVLP